MKASLSALANFSIEVLPTMEMLPDRSAAASVEGASVLAATLLSAWVLAAEDSAVAAVSLLPQATSVVIANIPAPTRANNLLCLTLIIILLHVVCFLSLDYVFILA